MAISDRNNILTKPLTSGWFDYEHVYRQGTSF